MKKWISAVMALALCILPATGAKASQLDAGFSVSAVIPHNQMDPEAAYFDLLMEPGTVQELAVLVENPGEEDLTVTVETVTASTNRSGIINYSTPGLYDGDLPFFFSDLAVPEEERVVIPPFTATEVIVVVTMPEEEYDGILLGSIRVVKEDAEDVVTDGIVNRFSYAIGVRLRVNENVQAPPEFQLGQVGANLVNYKAAIIIPIHSKTPAIIKDVEVTAKIYPSGESQPVMEQVQDQVDMAPYSVFPMSLVDQEGYGIPPGSYTAQVNLAWGEERWEFQQSFDILPDEAQAVNAGAVNQVQPAAAKARLPLVLMAILAGIMLCCAVIMVRAKRKKQ